MKFPFKLFPDLKLLVIENKYYWLTLGIVTLLSAITFWYQITYIPKIYYLSDLKNASWILENTPFDVNAKPYKRTTKLFKKNFTTYKPKNNITLYVKAFKFVRIFLDDNLIYESSTAEDKWKNLHKISIESIAPGEHELVAMVMNYDGPVALLLYSERLSLKTDELWLVNTEENDWSVAAMANVPKTSIISTKFSPAYEKLIDVAWLGLLALIIVIGAKQLRLSERFQFDSNKLRWIVFGCWGVLIVDNLLVTKLMGFDMIHHAEYIQFILDNGRLPLATDGLQMFQSPLFYILGSLFVKVASLIFSPEMSFHLLKIIPLLCGLGLVEVCYRCSRLAFPDRDDLQCIALLVGAMMPMNLYMSQYLGNEPLLGLLSGLCILMLLTWIRCPQYATQVKQQFLLGFLLGLALLAKATAFLLIPIALASVVFILLQANNSVKTVTFGVLRIASIILVVAGWFYLRNWLLLGKPFVGGWDAGRGLTWWQEPGYRNLNNFITFGQALVYPVYAATHSFWDAFYSTLWSDGLLGSQSTFDTRPPWNYSFILATVWLSLVPTIGLLTALICPIRIKFFDLKSRYIVLICCYSILLYVLAIIYLYFQLPIYSTVKASYSLGLLPCYALLIAFGLARFMENKVSGILVASALLWWSVSAYLGYFSTGIPM